MYGARTYGSSQYGGLIATDSLRVIVPADALSIGATLHHPTLATTETGDFLGITATLHTPSIVTQPKEIKIIINGIDYSDNVKFDSVDVSANLYSEPDTASFEILKSPTKAYNPAYGDQIVIEDSGVRIFAGILVKKRVSVNDFVEYYSLEFKDYTEEIGNRIIAKTYTNTTVQAIIADLFTGVVGYDYTTNVHDTTNITFIAFDNISITSCLDRLAELSGKIWFLSPFKEVYFDSKTAIVAPFEITDSNGNYYWSSLDIDEDISQIRNKVTIKGSGLAAVVESDPTSIATYGLREYYENDESITSTAGATQKAAAILAAFKDPIISASFETVREGLFSGQRIHVTSAIRGIDRYLNIESINFRSFHPNRFRYQVRATSQRLGGIEDLLHGIVTDPGTVIPAGDQNHLQNIQFTAIDNQTIQWTAGTITLSDGTVYSVNSRASQALTGDHVIYLDPSISTTELQISAVFTDGIGGSKVPLCYALRSAVSTTGATIIPVTFGGKMQISGTQITQNSILTNNIAANAIVGEKIAAGSVTADKASITTLDSLSANFGEMTSGIVTGCTIRTAASGRYTRMTSLNGIEFMNGASREGYLRNDGVGNLRLDADNSLYLSCTGTDDFIYLEGGSGTGGLYGYARDVLFESYRDTYAIAGDYYATTYNDDNVGAEALWYGSGANLRMSLDNAGDLRIDGSFIDTGADYAEYFESIDGEAIPVGSSVALVGDRVKKAVGSDYPIGVISKIATIIGNSDAEAGKSWTGKYQKDDFGAIIYEDADYWTLEEWIDVDTGEKERVKKTKKLKKTKGYSDETPPPEGATVRTVKRRKINPIFDEKKEYIPRKDRKEWNIVGLLGRVRIRKGEVTAPQWIKLKDISPDVEEWLIK